MTHFKKLDRVVVSAMQTGWGEDVYATVTDVEPFMGKVLVSVKYDNPLPDGTPGAVISNPHMLSHVKRK